MNYLEKIKKVRDDIQSSQKEQGEEFSYTIMGFGIGEDPLDDWKFIIAPEEQVEILRYLERRGFLEITDEPKTSITSIKIKVLPKKEPIIKLKTLELISRELKDHYTGYEITKLLEECGADKKLIIYPNSKWHIFYGLFEELAIAQDKKAKELLFRIICEGIHPLNLGGDKEKSEKLIEKFNEYLQYDDLAILSDGGKVQKYEVSNTKNLIELDEETLLQEFTLVQEEILPDINKSTFSEKVLHLVAKELESHLSTIEIRHLITPLLQKNTALSEEPAIKGYVDDWLEEKKWLHYFENVLQTIRKKDEEADKHIEEIIETLLHPLNYNADEEKTEEIAEKLKKYLRYDNFFIQNIGKEYLVCSEKEMDEMHSSSPEVEELKKEYKKADEEKIKQSIEILRILRDNHQAYMDILEIFCQDTKKPTKDLNDAYIFLLKEMEKIINKLDISHYEYSVFLYKPFKNDLYSAESEWKGPTNGQRLSWDTIRPSLYKVHSSILKLQTIAEENTEMTDNEKKLEKITKLISEKRTQKILTEKEEVTKMEILHKYEKNTENKFYITKIDDDFYYKGQYLKLSKKSEYYKVFCSLFARLHAGGEITYQELSKEIESRMPKAKGKSDEEMRKLIQDNLTGQKNGFIRYAKIPATEDNGKPLIETVRTSGISFNNKRG